MSLSRFTFLLLCTLLPFLLRAGDPLKDLVKKDFTYHSPLEERMFRKISHDTIPSMLEMMLATDKYTFDNDFERINARVDRFIDSLKLVTQRLPLDMKISAIFRHTHREFLKKYDLKVLASDLFASGYYNCVTGTALYAHIFDRMNIAYEIKETPDHVYLVTEGKYGRIPIESTDPMRGSRKPDLWLKKAYVQFLVDSKIISGDELDSNGMEQTFLKHYYSKTTISRKELAAIQYSNRGIYAMNDHRYFEAMPFLEKSYYLYGNNEKTKFLLLEEYVLYLAAVGYEKEEGVKALLKAYYSAPDLRAEVFYKHFLELKNEVLVNDANEKQFDDDYQQLKTGLGPANDSVLAKRISFVYHYEKGRYALANHDYMKALQYTCAAALMEPKNIELQQLIELAITRQVMVMSNPVRVINKLDGICESYGFVRKYPYVMSLYGFNYLKLANDYFDKKKTDEGEQLMDKFEALKETKLEPELISKVFVKASDAFLLENNKKQARYYLTKGLEFAPGDKALAAKLALLN